MAFSPLDRQANLERMQREPFDLLVIGGGITGAGVARDATLRGLSVVLIEKEDFASGTSGKSARLVHGGFRYLEQYQFGLVMNASTERYRLRRTAPRLVVPLPFTYPIYRDSRHSLLKIRMGMWLYDLLALLRNVRRHRILDSDQVTAQEPRLRSRGLVGAARYYDCLTDDARLTLTTVLSAHQAGACVANYAQACDLLAEEGRLRGAQVLDALTGRWFEVRARLTVNASGVWADTVRRLDDPTAAETLSVNRGSHLVLPRAKLRLQGAVAFASADGQRAMYAVPWDETCIVGTTDVDHADDLDRVRASAAEVRSIFDSTQKAFPQARLTPTDIISTFAGLRPLIRQEGQAAYQLPRDHHIFESENGLITIAGGKLTTYRRMAQDVVDRVAEKLRAEFDVQIDEPCRTARLPLTAPPFGAASAVERLVERHPQFDRRALAHLAFAYGAGAPEVLALAESDPALREPIVPGLPYLLAEVPYAVRKEMATTLSDVLIRRTHVIYEDTCQGTEAALEVAAIMARHLDWDAAEIERQLEAYHQQVALSRGFQEEMES